MKRVRDAVVIIILCIIGAVTFNKKAPQLSMPTPDEIKDAVAGNPTRRRNAPLTLASGHTDDLRDSVAGNPVGTPASNGTNSLDDIGGPPRGSGNGGFGPLATNNNIPPNPPPLSPSGPKDTQSNPCEGYGLSTIENNCN